MEMPVELLQANPKVRANAGKVAIQRGPLVYCLEEADNGSNLSTLSIAEEPDIKNIYDDAFLGGAVTVQAVGYRINEQNWGNMLYRPVIMQAEPVHLKAVPYFRWGNRGQGEMQVWIRQHC